MKFRDDDISLHTELSSIREFNSHYLKYNEIHTMAIIARDLWNNRELTYWLESTPMLDLQYHGLDHVDYSKLSVQECYDQLKEGKEYLEDKLHRPIRVFYPPWNIEDQMVRSVCQRLGLEFDNRRVEARDYLNGASGERVNLHYWQDLDIIDAILSKDKKSEARRTFHSNLSWFTNTIPKDGKVLHVGKTHVYDYRAYFPWATFAEIDTDASLLPDFHASIEKTGFSDKLFDGVLCFGVFEWIKDPTIVPKEIHRILKKDGRAIIGIPDNKTNREFHKAINELFEVVNYTTTKEKDLESFPNNSEVYHHYLVGKP